MTQITIDSHKLGLYLAILALVAIGLLLGGVAIYDVGHQAGVASVPVVTPTPTPVPTPTPAPVAATVVVAAPVVQVPQIDYINDVQSIGADYGYVCLVDGAGNEYLIMNFDPGTAELQGASYSGTVVSTYNGLPMLENVALTAYPVQYYNNYPDEYAPNYNTYVTHVYTHNNNNGRYIRYGNTIERCAGNLVCG